MNMKKIVWRGLLGRKVLALDLFLQQQQKVAIGFSGGADSTFLAAVAAQALGKNALAVTIDTPFLARAELCEARALARRLGLRHRVVRINVLEHRQVAANPPDRCYFCKTIDFQAVRRVARRAGIECLCDGSNVDDAGDYRPGARAVSELGVRSPLRECGFTKADIRAASRKLGLSTAAKPAMACLASRFPYGTPITAEALLKVERAEAALHALGFRQCRVRLHGDVGRLELPPADLGRAVAQRERILRQLKAAGLRYIALDLEGYRMGSLNEMLKKNE